MDISQGYILLLEQQQGLAQVSQLMLSQFPYSVVIADSTDQAVAQIQQGHPYLVILSGSQHNWSETVVQRLRETVKPADVTIVALTESSEPSWSPQEEHPSLDGFLVKPLSKDVLNSVVESARVKTSLKS
ncbi:MAG: hypothetical protein AAGF01_02700 [Cyanobacteria bacterium P01_G01_bin.38]